LFEVPQGELPATAKVVRQVMEGVVNLTAPLVVDLRAGANWAEMQPL
jgi:DNA polymerase-1